LPNSDEAVKESIFDIDDFRAAGGGR